MIHREMFYCMVSQYVVLGGMQEMLQWPAECWGKSCYHLYLISYAQIFRYKFGFPTRHSVFGTEYKYNVITNFTCAGTEDSLLNCSNSLVVGGCDNKMKSAGVICQSMNS